MDLSDVKKKEVVKELKPMLKLHLLATLSCNPAIRHLNKIFLKKIQLLGGELYRYRGELLNMRLHYLFSVALSQLQMKMKS